MAILVTGIAGFIGAHVARRLIARGDDVVGVDNLNDYYDPALKQARLDWVREVGDYRFEPIDLADDDGLEKIADKSIDRVVHLAAQAGVRYSLDNPRAYLRANLAGHLNVLEFCRHLPNCRHLVYASSSSVYGGNDKLPFAESDSVDRPVSLYAATKKADELMSHCYSHLYRLPQTGLRFFTVYGPWGRPDMALWLFTEAILAGRPIQVFNNGDMRRDFTYIDDIVDGVVTALDRSPAQTDETLPHRLYNIGNHRAEPLPRMIEVLENALGRKADQQFEPMQPGDVKETYADIAAIQAEIGFEPSTPIDVGIPRFVEWFLDYHKA